MELDPIRGNIQVESQSNSIAEKNIIGNLGLFTEYPKISLLNIKTLYYDIIFSALAIFFNKIAIIIIYHLTSA